MGYGYLIESKKVMETLWKTKIYYNCRTVSMENIDNNKDDLPWDKKPLFVITKEDFKLFKERGLKFFIHKNKKEFIEIQDLREIKDYIKILNKNGI